VNLLGGGECLLDEEGEGLCGKYVWVGLAAFHVGPHHSWHILIPPQATTMFDAISDFTLGSALVRISCYV